MSYRLSPAEIAFLSKYCTVMKLVVKALNILQAEPSTHMGWLLPVIFQLQAKLERPETSSEMCLPLIQVIQEGLQKRFGGMMEDPQLIAAAILLPKFKTSWAEPDVIEASNSSKFSCKAEVFFIKYYNRYINVFYVYVVY